MAQTHSSPLSGYRWRIVGWSGAAALLTVPAIAMQLTREVNWTASDFAVMGAVLLLAGLALEGLTRASSSWAARLGAGIAVLTGFLLVWVNLAVGIFGGEANPANLMFLGVIAVAVVASVLARGRPSGMARAMAITAAAQVAVSAIAYLGGMCSPGDKGIFEVGVSAALFGGLWLVSAGLFHLGRARYGEPDLSV